MIYILLAIAIMVSIKLTMTTMPLRNADKSVEKQYTILCEDAEICGYGVEYNQYSKKEDLALRMKIKVPNEKGYEVVEGTWFIAIEAADPVYHIGQKFPVLYSPETKRAIGVKKREELLKGVFAHTTAMILGYLTIAYLIFLIVKESLS